LSTIEQLEKHEKELIEQLYQKDKEIEDLKIQIKQLEDVNLKLLHEKIDLKVELDCANDDWRELRNENRELQEEIRYLERELR
jgi:chromosome segregation ATPase